MSEANRISLDATGNATIGAEHQVQTRLARALEKSLGSGDPDGDAAEILEQLRIFTSAHFLSEQLLMRLHGYAKYEKHCQEHNALLDLLDSVRQGFETWSTDQKLVRFKIFSDRIRDHIDHSDLELERFVSLTESRYNEIR